jgi:hypothetical protein
MVGMGLGATVQLALRFRVRPHRSTLFSALTPVGGVS